MIKTAGECSTLGQAIADYIAKIMSRKDKIINNMVLYRNPVSLGLVPLLSPRVWNTILDRNERVSSDARLEM